MCPRTGKNRETHLTELSKIADILSSRELTIVMRQLGFINCPINCWDIRPRSAVHKSITAVYDFGDVLTEGRPSPSGA
jgi:hypothetical protein